MAEFERRYRMSVQASTDTLTYSGLTYVKNDDTNYLECVFYDSSTLMPLDNTTITITIIRPDNTTGVYNDLVVMDGVITWKLPQSATSQAGTYTGTIELYQSGSRYTTDRFKYTVQDTLTDNGTVVNNEQYPVLTDLIRDVQALQNADNGVVIDDNAVSFTTTYSSDKIESSLNGKAEKASEHTHTNKSTLDRLSTSNGKLQFDGAEISGSTSNIVQWSDVYGKPTFASVATSGSYGDLSNKPTIPTPLSGDVLSHYHSVDRYTHPDSHPAAMITQDTTHRFVTDTQISTWNSGTSIGGGSTVADSTTNGNLLVNGVETNIYTHPDSHTVTMITGLSTVATSGSYNDLSNRPTIPAINDTTASTTSVYSSSRVDNLISGIGSSVTFVALTNGESVTINGSVDTTAPTITVSPATGTYNTTQTVTLSANETATIYYTLDGNTPTTSSSVYSTPISVSTTTTIRYFAVDTTGNSSTIQSRTYTIDTVAPNNVTNLATSNITANSLTLTWTASTSSDVASYDVYNGATLLGNTATTTYNVSSLTASTSYTFNVRARDAVGNVASGTSVTVTTSAVADTTAPNNVTNLTTSNVAQTTLTLSWTASTSSDVASYDIYNGSTYLGNTTTITYDVTGLTASTQYTFSVRARDGSGNVATGATVTVTTSAPADTTAPTVTASPAGGTYTSTQTVTLSANETATIYYTTNGTTPTTSSTVYTAPISISSTTTLQYFGRDTAGNSSTVQTQTYTINTTPTELVTNGSFDTDANGWTLPYPAEVTVVSGVLHANFAAAYHNISQQIVVSPSTSYTLKGTVTGIGEVALEQTQSDGGWVGNAPQTPGTVSGSISTSTITTASNAGYINIKLFSEAAGTATFDNISLMRS